MHRRRQYMCGRRQWWCMALLVTIRLHITVVRDIIGVNAAGTTITGMTAAGAVDLNPLTLQA